MLDEFMELTAIPVNSRDERAIADVLIKKLTALGLEVEEDNAAGAVGGNAGNIIAKLPGDPDVPWVLLSAHLDRVKNNGSIKAAINEKEGVFVSDGTTILAADDVSGICVILEGLRQMKAAGMPHGGIEVVFSVCEEAGVRGTQALDYAQISSKLAYVFDAPGKIGRIIHQAPTKCTIKVSVQGKSAHAGNEPEKGINAIRVAALALSRLKEGRVSEQTTSNFGVIRGGSSTNVVCDFVEILGEARSTDEEELKRYVETVRLAFDQTAREFNTAIDVAVDTLYHTFHLSESEEIIQIALAAMKRLGIEGFCKRGGGGMDGNRFNRKGIKAIGIAPGYGSNHTPNEYLRIQDFITCGALVKELIRGVYESKKIF
jgi:tripeptide aminopeptidase